jgi:SAM-dependent methyltransferase
MSTQSWRFPGRKRAHKLLDRFYVPLDGARVATPSLQRIPLLQHRHSRRSYAEWAHAIGVFQALLGIHLPKLEGNRICDVGCGTGMLGLAAESYVTGGGAYVGLDVKPDDIEFCRAHYPPDSHSFIHLETHNASYAPGQSERQLPWPLQAESFDVLTALSVWTHFAEEDALFYMREVDRVLRPGGRALITFFLLDRAYEERQASRSGGTSPFQMRSHERWRFDRPAYASKEWLSTAWARPPEQAIGITERALGSMLEHTQLHELARHAGSWRAQPGITLQDVLVFEKRPDRG